MIVQCNECGKDVSTEALACPACGYPQKSKATIASKLQSRIFGWVALIAFFMSNFTPAILAPLIVIIAIVFAAIEFKQGGKKFGGILLLLCLLQVWFIADHFGGLSASLGLTTPKQIEERAAQKYENVDLSLPNNSDQIIQEKCSGEWPTDFNMQQHCKKQQQAGISKLAKGMPSDIPSDTFRIIRGKCTTEWPRDFNMRSYCESQQYEGYRSLQMSGQNNASRARCAQKWPNDYKMRKYCENKG